MLRPLVKALIGMNNDVSVIARSRSGFVRLRRELTPIEQHRMHSYLADYNSVEELSRAIKLAIAKRGEISSVIAWIHSDVTQADQIIYDLTFHSQPNFRYFKIIGSSSYDPSLDRVEQNMISEAPFANSIRGVVLGFMLEEGNSRWLTKEEISQGILQAIEQDIAEFTVGVTRPWRLKP